MRLVFFAKKNFRLKFSLFSVIVFLSDTLQQQQPFVMYKNEILIWKKINRLKHWLAKRFSWSIKKYFFLQALKFFNQAQFMLLKRSKTARPYPQLKKKCE